MPSNKGFHSLEMYLIQKIFFSCFFRETPRHNLTSKLLDIGIDITFKTNDLFLQLVMNDIGLKEQPQEPRPPVLTEFPS
jgi:hypothetical protein